MDVLLDQEILHDRRWWWWEQSERKCSKEKQRNTRPVPDHVICNTCYPVHLTWEKLFQPNSRTEMWTCDHLIDFPSSFDSCVSSLNDFDCKFRVRKENSLISQRNDDTCWKILISLSSCVDFQEKSYHEGLTWLTSLFFSLDSVDFTWFISKNDPCVQFPFEWLNPQQVLSHKLIYLICQLVICIFLDLSFHLRINSKLMFGPYLT